VTGRSRRSLADARPALEPSALGLPPGDGGPGLLVNAYGLWKVSQITYIASIAAFALGSLTLLASAFALTLGHRPEITYEAIPATGGQTLAKTACGVPPPEAPPSNAIIVSGGLAPNSMPLRRTPPGTCPGRSGQSGSAPIGRPVRRNRGPLHRRPRRRHRLRPAQDRRPRPRRARGQVQPAPGNRRRRPQSPLRHTRRLTPGRRREASDAIAYSGAPTRHPASRDAGQDPRRTHRVRRSARRHTHPGNQSRAFIICKLKAPREVDITIELPKTSAGKIQKFILRDKEWAGHG
jgi:hypothetical protein